MELGHGLPNRDDHQTLGTSSVIPSSLTLNMQEQSQGIFSPLSCIPGSPKDHLGSRAIGVMTSKVRSKVKVLWFHFLCLLCLLLSSSPEGSIQDNLRAIFTIKIRLALH